MSTLEFGMLQRVHILTPEQAMDAHSTLSTCMLVHGSLATLGLEA